MVALLSFKETYKNFKDMESKLDLFSKKVAGVYFWERVRYEIFEEILRKKGFFGQSSVGLNHFSSSQILFFSVKNLIIKNPYVTSQSDVLFLGFPRRKLLGDGCWWDIFCDPIIECLQRSYTYLSVPSDIRHFSNAKTKKIKYYFFPIVLASFINRFSLKSKLTASERQILLSIQEYISTVLSVKIDIEKVVKQSVMNRRSEMPFIRVLLKRMRPKVAIVLPGCGRETFIEACKTLGVPVIELQHGFIGPNNLAYSFYGSKNTTHTFADYLFVWGDFWMGNTQFPINKNRIFGLGYPFLENQVKQYDKIKKLNQIIFISQGCIGTDIVKFAINLSKQKELGYKIIYKLHPEEYSGWTKNYPELKKSSIEVIDNDRIPLYQLLAQSKIQIGVYSTVIYEGLVFQLKTFLLNLPGVDHMDYLIQNQHAILVSSIDDLVAAIKNIELIKPVDPEHFFKKDSITNILSKIEAIIENQAS